MKILLLGLLLAFSFPASQAQDTYSIVAVDSTTREVGSAGASCVDLILAGFEDASFLGDLLPDTGVINSQSFYLASNQNNARTRMRTGDTPAAIVSWLVQNDIEGNPHVRQYGIAGFSGDQPSAAAFTGENCFDYKQHITGSINGIYYAIQGNILQGAHILTAMEARFREAEGNLACRLMAALQGANVVGADTRCTTNGTSALFAFVKVAQPDDTYGIPSFIRTVTTRSGAGIEPVDSLQVIFDAVQDCLTSSTGYAESNPVWHFNPNPASDEIRLMTPETLIGATYTVYDARGRICLTGNIDGGEARLDIGLLPPGWYAIHLDNHGYRAFIKQQ